MAVFGDTLRQARAHKGVTLKEAEQATRISRHHLLALEEGQFDDLPPLIYQRGIVRNYATYLSLDPHKLLSMFNEARGNVPDEQPVILAPQPDLPTHWAPNFAVIAFLVVMSAVLFAWMYSAYFAPSEVTSTPTELIPTVTAVSASDTIFLPSPTPSPTASPTATATAQPVEAVDDAEIFRASVEEPPEVTNVIEEVTEAPPTPTAMSGALTFNYAAVAYVESLQIVADGAVVFEGALDSGSSTGYLSADNFQVYVSDPGALSIVRENGDSFFMGDRYFALP